jgi:hypothetical protein
MNASTVVFRPLSSRKHTAYKTVIVGQQAGGRPSLELLPASRKVDCAPAIIIFVPVIVLALSERPISSAPINYSASGSLGVTVGQARVQHVPRHLPSGGASVPLAAVS